MSEVYTLRLMKKEDEAFILATFLRGVYYGDSWFSAVPKDIFMKNYHIVATALLDKATAIVACLTDEPDVILGYALISKDCVALHFVYVKKDFRKHGIAKAMVPATIKFVTHLTAEGKSLLTKLPSAVFNPFAISQ